mgnify:CR=1 FL=1
MARKKLTPYQRIMREAQRGRGVRLSADDVWALSFDDAISTRASHDDEADETLDILADAARAATGGEW